MTFSPSAVADDDLPELAEVATPQWFRHGEAMTQVGFLTVARRLPRLIRQALTLAWQASPRDTLATVTLNVLSGVFTAFGLLATTGVLTALFEAGPTPDRVRTALPSLLLVGAAAGARALLQAGAGWAQSRLGPQVSRITEQRLYEVTSQVDLVCFDDPEFHDALQRAQIRGMRVAAVVVTNAVNVVTGVVGIAAAAGVLGVLHPALLPLLLLAILPDAWAAVRSARMGYIADFLLIVARRRKWIVSDLLVEKSVAAEVRTFTMRGYLLRMFNALARTEQQVMLDLARRQTLTRIVGQTLSGIGQGLVYVALGVLLAIGAVPLAVAGTAVLAIRSGQSSLANFMYATNQLYEEGLYFADYLDFQTQAQERMPTHRTRPAPAGFQRITVQDVTFTYPGAGDQALAGVSITIARGEMVALVGENGSGKTTLSKMLAGLYEPDGGRILWDDRDLCDVDPDQLRSQIAVIAQDHTHWPLTARDTITMGRDGDEEAVARAAAVAGADQVIAELPLGYRSLLDRRFKNGVELSGGQWQRIAVARGFYRGAPLLICDEPTAALDARAEHALFEQIRQHADGRTVLLITHRLASVRYADRIYVLDHGKVCEQGTHQELMELDGLYAELYNLQARAYHATA